MIKSLSTQECFHFFANKVQPEGYSRSRNVSFHGNCLYSYSAPIGKWLPDDSLAIATRNYSPTTLGHQNDLRRATPRTVKVISVYGIDTVDGVFSQARVLAAQLNKKALTARIHGDYYRGQARDIVANANAYAEALGDPQRIVVAELTPEQERADKEALKAADKEEKARKAEREAYALEVNAERLEKWLSGDTSVSSYGLRELAVKLRVRGAAVETTQGAAIPLADAIKLWPVVQRCRKGDKCFTPGQPLGYYKLTQIRSDGTLIVGCHTIPYSELQRIATQLNLV
jgi:hypothetical protein